MNGVTDFSGSPHRNKKAYDITLQMDAGTNNYRSRIGFNIYPIDIGQYTIIFEFFPPEMNNIQSALRQQQLTLIGKSVKNSTIIVNYWFNSAILAKRRLIRFFSLCMVQQQ